MAFFNVYLSFFVHDDFMRIIIVEDEFNLIDVIASSFIKINYEVDIGADGEEGLYKTLSDIYDLIILDIMLSSMEGLLF